MKINIVNAIGAIITAIGIWYLARIPSGEMVLEGLGGIIISIGLAVIALSYHERSH